MLGAPGTDVGFTNSGAVYVYSGSFIPTLEQRLLPVDPSANKRFGYAVALEGNVAVVGAPFENRGVAAAGSAYVFRKGTNGWAQEAKLVAPDSVAFHQFGTAVAIRGTTILIGAPGDGTTALPGTGAVYHFEYSGGSWNYVEKLVASPQLLNQGFGHALAMGGNFAVIGTLENAAEGSFPGQAYVFQPNGGSWTQRQILTAGASSAFDDRFGASVGVIGTAILVGAPGDSQGAVNAGAGFLFRFGGTSWGPGIKIQPPTMQANSFAGSAVAGDAWNIFLGAPFFDGGSPDSGRVSVFTSPSAGSPQFVTNLAPATSGTGAQFGSAMASGGKSGFMVGEPRRSQSGAQSGLAYFASRVLPLSTVARVCIPPDCD